MSRLHSALAESRWDGADLGTLVRQTLQSYTADTPGRVVVRGESLVLPAAAVSGVSMALHELATNAAHFGALSVPEGRVEVAWAREKGEDGEPVLRLVWTEGGGPGDVEQTPPPNFTGAGRPRLDIPGRANLQFVEGGVRCELVVPLGAPAH